MPTARDAGAAAIEEGRTALGVELGSTTIKACLIDDAGEVLAVGRHTWANQYVDGTWTYAVDDVWSGLQGCIRSLLDEAEARYQVRPARFGSMGVSAMMHGYLALGADGEPLVPFRTWRNTSTTRAADRLTEVFGYNVPQRWSVAHLYQAILDEEEHVRHIRRLTTLAGYVHAHLTGRHVLGVGDASGMFPVDPGRVDYDQVRLEQFRLMVDGSGCPPPIELLPQVLIAGEDAGHLTANGALLLDPAGGLVPGIPFCPPEGDAATGMVSTNAVAPRTGNVSVGTSVFAMVVLERPLKRVHRDVDLVTTPVGRPVAMVHCNNGSSELAAWVDLFAEVGRVFGQAKPEDSVYPALFAAAMRGEADAGGVITCNYLSGEPITDVLDGRPLVLRSPGSTLTLANFMRAQLYSVFATLSLGMEILRQEEVVTDLLMAHGGLFRTPGAAQDLLAAAVNAPIAVSTMAGEGGAWGMAILAAYRQTAGTGTLEEYLHEEVFHDAQLVVVDPSPQDVSGFQRFLHGFVSVLPVVRAAAASQLPGA